MIDVVTYDFLRSVVSPVPYNCRLDELWEHFEPAMWSYEIDTPERVAMFVAQTAHESDRFCALEEYASGRAYEGRRDLGNTRPGDGVRFKGRGLIQITGRANYTRCSIELFGDERELLEYPEQLAEPGWAVTSAAWFWDDKGLNSLADRADLEGCTRRINGGLNGLDDRRELYRRARRYLQI